MTKENTQNYRVGMVYENECGHCKTPELELDEDSIIIKFFEHSMNSKVIEQFDIQAEFDLQLHDLCTLLLFKVKVGDIEEDIFWGYCKNNGKDVNLETDNYEIDLLLFDTFSGELCAKKSVLLGSEQTKHIKEAVSFHKEHPIDAKTLRQFEATAVRYYLFKMSSDKKGNKNHGN